MSSSESDYEGLSDKCLQDTIRHRKDYEEQMVIDRNLASHAAVTAQQKFDIISMHLANITRRRIRAEVVWNSRRQAAYNEGMQAAAAAVPVCKTAVSNRRDKGKGDGKGDRKGYGKRDGNDERKGHHKDKRHDKDNGKRRNAMTKSEARRLAKTNGILGPHDPEL